MADYVAQGCLCVRFVYVCVWGGSEGNAFLRLAAGMIIKKRGRAKQRGQPVGWGREHAAAVCERTWPPAPGLSQVT